ncbi:FG-GAP repeat protein [Streptomyces sp. NPDC007988]|uniref:FG-GAP repeat protein n=1 Tax=Streptomyces sp. NPDC007988 TaxID=3364802 RepID=UPI0036EEB03C
MRHRPSRRDRRPLHCRTCRVASGDFDHDGRQDVIGRTAAGAAHLYHVNNQGGFAPSRLITSKYWKRYGHLS